MPRSEFYYSEMHSQVDDNDIEKLQFIDPQMYVFYLDNKHLMESKNHKKTARDYKTMDILGNIEMLCGGINYSDIELGKASICKSIGKIHQKINALDLTGDKQPDKKKSASKKLLSNIDKMPKYKPMSVKTKK